MRLRIALSFVLFVACAGQPKKATKNAQKPAAAAMPSLTLDGAPQQSGVERIFVLKKLADSPSRGPDNAKVTLAVCSDFECPYCGRLEPTLDELVENYGELVRVEWRHCPLPFHEHALPAAEASQEVFAQTGNKGFWAYHNILFAHQDALEPNRLIEYARQVQDVDVEKLAIALADHRHLARIAADLSAIAESGAASGGFGTPATFINGRLLSGALPYETFEDAVERALQESPEARAQAEAQSAAAYPSARVRHILIQYKGAKNADAKITRTKEEAFSFAQKLHDAIVLEHKDMATLAKESSDCPSHEEGGELGRFTRGELVAEFERALFSLAPGDVSNVVETPFGYHVILREE